MAVKTGPAIRRSVRMDWDCELEDVLVSKVTDRTLVVYAISDGDFKDPATNIQRRVAWFVGQTVWDGKDLRQEVAAAKEKMSSSYHAYFEGLLEAFYDEPIEDKQEADNLAERHRRDTEQLENPERASSWYGGDLRRNQELYADFMTAIDSLAENEDDEKAWAAIDAWRNRLVEKHEK